MSVTVRDIAKAANVSINTVSRALNGKDDVKKETRAKILAIAEELDYVPNMLARGLLRNRTKTIGVVISDNSNPFNAGVLRGIEHCARDSGYSMILCNSDEDPGREAEALRTLKTLRVDGILITPTSTREGLPASLIKRKIPFVLCNRSTDDANIDYVKTDNVFGASLAGERLLEIGRRHLCHLGGPTRISSAVERAAGFRKAIEEAGLGPDTITEVETALHMEDGYIHMKRLLESGVPMDGLFTYSDIIAIGAMRAIREAGRRIPDDIAVIGFDDIEIASYLEVALTTVRQKRHELGWKAAELLIQRLNAADEEEHVSQHIICTPELIIRKSA